ncbi:MAG: hypothetical protein HQK77_13155 [Desulfobacterales bacterium]|nr:hypothetical protein [Desulfobacterales bacterium]
MQSIREIRTVGEGGIIHNLPQIFWGQEVEIIIFHLHDQNQDQTRIKKKRLQGCLQDYAKPELIEMEKDAWSQAIGDKHVYS